SSPPSPPRGTRRSARTCSGRSSSRGSSSTRRSSGRSSPSPPRSPARDSSARERGGEVSGDPLALGAEGFGGEGAARALAGGPDVRGRAALLVGRHRVADGGVGARLGAGLGGQLEGRRAGEVERHD